MRARTLAAVCASSLFAASSARALDLPKILKKPLTLEVTEVSILAQRFDSRQSIVDEGGPYGQWINRLNAQLNWNHITVGVRLDSAAYWNTLGDTCQKPTDSIGLIGGGSIPCGGDANNPSLFTRIRRDDLARFQPSIYPAKLWATYSNKGVEITIGDAYVQFARGLVLSMRKFDDLGVDNTIRGIKANVTRGPFAVTLIGGMANPSRVDEASGQALFVQKTVPPTSPVYSSRGPQPIFGADQLVGAEIQAGRGKPVVLTSSMSYLNRCAPFSYRNSGAFIGRTYNADINSELFGACDDSDISNWLLGLPRDVIARQARHVSAVAESIELPKIGKLGAIYFVGVVQHRDGILPGDYQTGTALYGTYTSTFKNVSNTFEFKSYRNFYSVPAAIDTQQVSAFVPVVYSVQPTIEAITQDNMLGNFNLCVDGGRIRTDIRINKQFLWWMQGIYTYSKTEQNTVCDSGGNIIGATGKAADALSNMVFDGMVGFQWDLEQGRSRLFATLDGREDVTGTGQDYLHQMELNYTFSKYLSKRSALEFIGRHRVRWERVANLGSGQPQTWVEGENYTGINFAPKWIVTQGIEYTTRDLPTGPWTSYPPWLYLNGGLTYRFTKDSNIRILVGQQRGGLKCISGVCRIFPSFEGARAELTVRF